MSASSPEHNIGSPKGAESASSIVSQPVKIESHLGEQLGSFLDAVNKMSESAPSGPGEQGGAGGTAATAQGTGTSGTGMSARDMAIAQIPAAAIMQKDLEKHIRDEVKKLRKQAKDIARIGKPGAAYHLNQLYGRIRVLNALMAELLSASVDVLKRMFVRVFIDKQPII